MGVLQPFLAQPLSRAELLPITQVGEYRRRYAAEDLLKYVHATSLVTALGPAAVAVGPNHIPTAHAVVVNLEYVLHDLLADREGFLLQPAELLLRERRVPCTAMVLEVMDAFVD